MKNKYGNYYPIRLLSTIKSWEPSLTFWEINSASLLEIKKLPDIDLWKDKFVALKSLHFKFSLQRSIALINNFEGQKSKASLHEGTGMLL